ncbi:DEKNAAC101249 [Brettanomyces naardenensis]|uniref:DEKNAAC101250 n=1 Tax=Brettanomyces naardenensis TaxID=13370 RepID=A0A448YHR5_BRENA|nr:DEKNAAC101249 [Brettanomyces naardenensis]
MVSPAVESFKHYPYLISKWLDPLFGISIGVAAYYAYEKRAGREAGHSLEELLSRKWQRWQVSRKQGK